MMNIINYIFIQNFIENKLSFSFNGYIQCIAGIATNIAVLLYCYCYSGYCVDIVVASKSQKHLTSLRAQLYSCTAAWDHEIIRASGSFAKPRQPATSHMKTL